MTTPAWSPQQAAALEKVGEWLRDPTAPQVFRLFGYAGTGKTTLAMHLAEQARNPMFAAFTGKAASVLRSKGCPNAGTLHALLYNVRDRDRARLDELSERLSKMSPTDPDYEEIYAERAIEFDKVKRPWFYVNPESALKDADLLVCDEVSMVDAKIGKDMESFGKKILVLGDPAQLPPIAGGGYFTKAKPDILLSEIHRQAADNPLLRWATIVRKGGIIPFEDLGTARKMRRDMVDTAWLADARHQILCGKNETRRELNQRIRKFKGLLGEFPERGDVLVMLQNDNRLGVLNGTICWAYSNTIEDPNDPQTCYFNIKYPDDRHARLIQDVKIDANLFRGRPPADGRGRLQMDFGYALTVHKAQGSQWPEVVLYDDGMAKRESDMRAKWLYTAITRAEHRVTILVP